MSVADPFGLVGQVLDGQFRVDKLVGEGGFSAVYRGHHQGLNEPIAIKSLKLPSSLGTALVDTFVARFRDESRILYRLSQGNLHIVRSIAAGTTQAPLTGALVPYMVLEWLEGRSVQNDFTVRRTLGQTGRSLDVVLKLFDSAADGLGYAHSQGVAHRDLNPGNLFLAQTQHGLKMKVLDFGVAKLMHDGALDMGPRAHTVGQIKIFAPAYGAPEQFDDRVGTVGTYSDVYAFALILIEALRDKSVNEGAHLGEFAQSACDPDRRPTPRAFGIDVPDEVEAAFARATTLDPKQRWQTASDFWQSLSIASKLATERRYESAARETPPLAMGATPPPSPVTPGPAAAPRDAAAVKNLARTIPLGSATLPRPSPGAPPGAPRPRTPTTIGIPPPAGARAPGESPAASRTATGPGPGTGTTPGTGTAPTAAPLAAPPRTMAMPMTPGIAIIPPRAVVRPPSSQRNPATTTAPAPPLAPRVASNPDLAFANTDAKPPSSPERRRAGSSVPTSVGMAPGREPANEVVDIPSMDPLQEDPDEDEDEDEATKVHAPAPEILRTLAFHDAANARAQAEAMIARERAAREAAAKPPYVDPNEDIPEPPGSGGTLMMAPVARQQMMDAAAPPPPPQERNQSLSSTLAMASPLQPTGPMGHAGFTPAGQSSQMSDPNDWGAPTQAMAAVPMPPVQAAPGMQGIPGAHGTPPQGVPAVSLPGNPPLPYGQRSAVIGSQQQPAPQHPHAPPSAVPLSRQQGEPAFPPPSFAQPAAPPKAPLPILPIAIVLGVLALGGIVMGALALRARQVVPTDGDAAAASSVPMASVSLTPVPVALPDDSTPAVATAVPVPAVEEDAAVDASLAVAPDAAPAVPAPAETAAATAAAPPPTAPVPTTAPPNPFGQPTSTPIATPPPKPTADPNAFSESTARAKLGQANGMLAFCHKEGGVTGNGSASVTFAPDGSVAGVSIDPPFAGTKEGDCVASQFRRVKVNAFIGSPQTVRTPFEVPK